MCFLLPFINMELKINRTITLAELEELEKEAKKKENKESKKIEGRFHLPVLYLNDPTQWEMASPENMRVFSPDISEKTCVGNCCGHEGLKSGCCHVDPTDLEHVLGPVDEKWIKRIIQWFSFKQIFFKREDIVIDYEEDKIIGEMFFRGHEIFSSKSSYPMLRWQVTGPRFACKFLSTVTGRCTIYAERPQMCEDYFCSYLKANFLLKTREHPNRYVKLR